MKSYIVRLNIDMAKSVSKNLWILPSIVVIFISICIVYPGGFSYDSYEMYDLAVGSEKLNDIKPLFSVFLMRLGVTLFGDGGLVIINSVIYLIGVILISSALFISSWSRLFISLLLISFPPLLLINLSNWIDSILLSGLSVSVGCILFYVYRIQKIYLLIWASFFSIWALLARHNAPSVVFFIQFLIIHYMVKKITLKINKIFMMVIGVIVLFSISISINPMLNKIYKVKHTPLWSWIYIYDLASVSLLENRNLIPRELIKKKYINNGDEEILASLRKVFNPIHNWNLGDIVCRDIDLTFMPYYIKTIMNYSDSLLYTRYRTNIAWLTQPEVAYKITTNDKKAKTRNILPQKRNKIYKLFLKFAEKLRHETIFFHGIWYLMAAFLLFFLSFLLRIPSFNGINMSNENILIFFFTLAGIFTWLPIVPMSVTAEFRYLIPLVFLVTVSIIIFIKKILKIISVFSNNLYFLF